MSGKYRRASSIFEQSVNQTTLKMLTQNQLSDPTIHYGNYLPGGHMLKAFQLISQILVNHPTMLVSAILYKTYDMYFGPGSLSKKMRELSGMKNWSPVPSTTIVGIVYWSMKPSTERKNYV